jgi:hypothetical protein
MPIGALQSFEQQPAGFLQHRRESFARHAARFFGADLVESLVHLRHDMTAFGTCKPGSFEPSHRNVLAVEP